MVFRTAGALATLLIGLMGPGGPALAQYAPPPHAYPPPQGYPPYRPLPPVAAEDDAPTYDPPMIQGRPLPPAAIGPQVYEPVPPPPGARFGRRAPVQVEEAELPPPPPGYIYRDGAMPPGSAPPPVYREGALPPGSAPPPVYREGALPPGSAPQQAYPDQPPPGVQGGFEPAAAGSRPYYGLPGAPSGPNEQEAMRPPMPLAPGQMDQNATGAVRGDPRTHMAALPPEVRPETGPRKQLPPQFLRTLVEYRTKEPVGTIIIDTQNTYLYLVLGNGQAMRYGVGVGREGFTWAGAEKVTKMAEWPDWNPPSEMIERQPYLPRFMAGGEGNPLGARALYLGKTIYRIHGTNQPSTIGTFVSSGCIRLTNEDVADLYTRVKVGTRVVVLPGRPPATAAATPIGPQSAVGPGAPPVNMAPLGPPPGARVR